MPETVPPLSAWPTAARLIAQWLDRKERIDAIMESLPPTFSGPERARCQHLVFGVLRHCGRIQTLLESMIAHPPRFSTRAVLYLAGYELIEAQAQPEDGLVAKIVHHAVEQTKTLSSPAESRMVNAVVRKLAVALQAQPVPGKLAQPLALADYYSHPEWLVRRWLPIFGAEGTRKLLSFNQEPAKVYARWRDAKSAPPDWFVQTPWAGFYELPSGRWAEVEVLVKEKKVYLQNPGSRLAVELLAPQKGETMIDLCAAPGGKSVLSADMMGSGRIVAVDLPGARLGRLKSNLSMIEGVDVALVQADLLEGYRKNLEDSMLPTQYTAVLLDVPCSNTGVMQHRVDVKWRLDPLDIAKHAKQQLAMLTAAAGLVVPGGRLVYSTCSIDPEENTKVVKAFTTEQRGHFTLEKQVVALPWECGHDGAGAFLLRRT